MTDLHDGPRAAEPAPPTPTASSDMLQQAEAATAFLKAMAHSGRLKILCHLAMGEKSVTDLEALLGNRQAAVSQQLARLRLEGIVSTRREGKAIHYRLTDEKSLRLVRLMHELYCPDQP